MQWQLNNNQELGEEEEEKTEIGEKNNLLRVGDRYMVLDLGGGTGDIVCHHIIAENEIEEIRPPTGGKSQLQKILRARVCS